VSDDAVNQRVLEIIKCVRERGDAALVEFTRQFDALDVAGMAELILPRERLELALTRISVEQRRPWKKPPSACAATTRRQKQDSWSYTEADGTVLGQKVTPLDRAGLYVPGGKAAYPSSVLMNAIPAKVAGVPEVVMVVPTPRGELNELVLAAACIAGVDRVFTIGGAQAVAALAYGTESVPPVDKIVGPGNIYVATAKRHVFGKVGIDMIAGPSEILVVCDGGPIRTGSPWTCSPRPSTTRTPSRSWSARMRPFSIASPRASPGCCRPWSASRSCPRLPARPRRADPGGRHGRGHRGGQPYRPGAPGAFGG
jgi:histidinol dehydrogenase